MSTSSRLPPPPSARERLLAPGSVVVTRGEERRPVGYYAHPLPPRVSNGAFGFVISVHTPKRGSGEFYYLVKFADGVSRPYDENMVNLVVPYPLGEQRFVYDESIWQRLEPVLNAIQTLYTPPQPLDRFFSLSSTSSTAAAAAAAVATETETETMMARVKAPAWA
jgi:hypothetical protein